MTSILTTKYFLAATVVTAVLASTQAAPALTASATQCTLSPQSQSGIYCGDPSGSGSIGTPTTGNPSGSAPTACRYAANTGDLPSTFWDFSSRPYAEIAYDDETGHNIVRVYHENDEIIGVLRTHTNPATHAYTVVADNMSVPEILQEAAFDCLLSADGWSWRVEDDPRDNLSAPSGPAPAESPLLSFSSAMVALPGKPDEYLLRVNLTNDTTRSATASVEFSRKDWSAVTMVSSPTDVTCGVQEGVEFCQAAAVAAGTSESLVFDVKTASESAPLPVSVISDGYLKMKLSAALPASFVSGPVPSQILVARP